MAAQSREARLSSPQPRPASTAIKARLEAQPGPSAQHSTSCTSPPATRATARLATTNAAGLAVDPLLAVSGLGPRAARRWGDALGAERTLLQGSGGLGLRMQRQRQRACRERVRSLVLIGSDLPGLSTASLLQAFLRLRQVPLVLGPAHDGGYWLIGLSGSWPLLFAGADSPIPWGSDQVLARTLRAADRLGLVPEPLQPAADLDRAEDLERWR